MVVLGVQVGKAWLLLSRAYQAEAAEGAPEHATSAHQALIRWVLSIQGPFTQLTSYAHGQAETFQGTLPCSPFSTRGSCGDCNPCYHVFVHTSHLHDLCPRQVGTPCGVITYLCIVLCVVHSSGVSSAPV